MHGLDHACDAIFDFGLCSKKIIDAFSSAIAKFTTPITITSVKTKVQFSQFEEITRYTKLLIKHNTTQHNNTNNLDTKTSIEQYTVFIFGK